MRHTLYYIIITIGMLVGLTATSICAKADTPPDAPFTIVLDPGHGGKDYGCIGKLTNEKTIVLDVAKRVGDIIAREHPEVRRVFTRDDDRFIELSERAAIANRAGADLFVSIHVNSIDKRTKGRENVHGASVYTLGLHRNESNLNVAMRENGVIELEKDYTENYQGFDPSSTESYIIFELSQNHHMHQSVEFADAVQQQLMSHAGRADKGVRQAGFLVLHATSMPAVLVELDFICNPEAERFLASDQGRQKCAESIARAFSGYYARNSRTRKGADQQPTALAETPVEAAYAVQFLKSDRLMAGDDPALKGMPDVAVIEKDGAYNYISGSFKNLKDAKKHLRKVKKSFADAFIIKHN